MSIFPWAENSTLLLWWQRLLFPEEAQNCLLWVPRQWKDFWLDLFWPMCLLQWDNSLSVSGDRMNGGVRSIIWESSGYPLTDDERTLICNWNTLYQNTHIKPWLITHRSELSQTFRTGTELFISESQTSKKLAAHYRVFVSGKLASGREPKWIKTTWRSSPFAPLFPFPLAIWIPSPGDRSQFSII